MAAQSDEGSAPTAAQIDAIATKTFPKSLRGWDSAAVRVHLVAVADIVRTLNRRIGELEGRLHEAESAARRADLTQLDPDEVDAVLGEETGRVLRAARASAAEIEQRAAEQAEVIAADASNEASRVREHANIEAQRLQSESAEAAAATRTAGEAHIDELRAAAETELTEARDALEAELAEMRQTTRDETAATLAAAEDQAGSVRRQALDEATHLREHAETEAKDRLAQATAEVEALRKKTKMELDEATEVARQQVAEAERMRERVLADLARRRKAARQHLEQLHAGRERLLAAYEVIRTTTDVATDELGVVLSDAKRAADDAARRIAAEPTPGTDEMLAELDLARMANLPLIAPPSGTEVHADETDNTNDAADTADTGDVAGAAPDGSTIEPGGDSVDGGDEVRLDHSVADSSANDESPPNPHSVNEVVTPVRSDVSKPSQPLEPRRPSKRPRRRGHDPLAGETLPAVPLVPIVGAADFEGVRVLPGATATERVTTDDLAVTSKPATQSSGDESVGKIDTAGAPTDEPGESPDAPEQESSAERALAAVAQGVTHSPEKLEVEVSGIFDRLRADQSATISSKDAPAKIEIESTSTKTDTASAQVATAASTTVQAAKPKPDAPADDASVNGDQPSKTPAVKSTKSKENVPATESADDRLARIFEQRDAAVDEVARRLSKHLKRQLSDQQSGLLDELRRTRRIESALDVLGPVEEFCGDWAQVVRDDLSAAVNAGVTFAGDLSKQAAGKVEIDLAAVARELDESVGVLLYHRLEAVIEERDAGADDDEAAQQARDGRDMSDRVRACYREWRGPRLTSAVADACARAFGEAVRLALGTTGVQWECGPGAQPCGDCNDNHLAGVIEPGETFPTGHRSAPAHPGCRCLALPPL